MAITSDVGENSNANQTRYNRFVERVIAHGVTVHSLLLRSVFSGRGSDVQTGISMHLTQITGGRYEPAGASTVSEKLESLAVYISLDGRLQ